MVLLIHAVIVSSSTCVLPHLVTIAILTVYLCQPVCSSYFMPKTKVHGFHADFPKANPVVIHFIGVFWAASFFWLISVCPLYFNHTHYQAHPLVFASLVSIILCVHASTQCVTFIVNTIIQNKLKIHAIQVPTLCYNIIVVHHTRNTGENLVPMMRLVGLSVLFLNFSACSLHIRNSCFSATGFKCHPFVYMYPHPDISFHCRAQAYYYFLACNVHWCRNLTGRMT